MPHSKRTRMICIRLSEEEYDQLQSNCDAQGVAISQLIRAAVTYFTSQQNGNARPLLESINEIDGRVSSLDREVARLSALIGLARTEKTQ